MSCGPPVELPRMSGSGTGLTGLSTLYGGSDVVLGSAGWPVFAGGVIVPCTGVGTSVGEAAGVPQELHPLVVVVYSEPQVVPQEVVPQGLQEVVPQDDVHTGV